MLARKKTSRRKTKVGSLLAAAARLASADPGSLAAVVVSAQVEKNLEKLRQLIRKSEGWTLEERIDHVVGPAVGLFLANRTLFRLLLSRSPRLDSLEEALGPAPSIRDAVERALRSHREELRVKDARRAAFVSVQMVSGLIQGAILDYPEGVPEMDLRRDAVRAVRTYLVASRQ